MVDQRAAGIAVAFVAAAFFAGLILSAGQTDTVFQQLLQALHALEAVVLVFGAFVVYALFRRK